MNNNSRSISKGVTGLLALLSMIGCWVSTDMGVKNGESFRNRSDVGNDYSWGTLHSILSIVFTLLIIIHIWQHWKLIVGIIKKNLYSRNIVTTLTSITFLVTVVSFLLYLTGFSHSKGEFHGTIGNIFLITCCVHLVLNFRKMLVLFEWTMIREGSWLNNYISGSYSPKAVKVFSSIFRRKDQINK
jgi:hypothetical protein